jgi:hypothetical protein
VPLLARRPASRFPSSYFVDLKAAEGLSRIDFIKLDIEGAEASALRGASRTIREDKPRLAISLYHRLQDFYELPLLLRGLNPGYRFAIDHYSIHSEETVLYAWEGVSSDGGAGGAR